MLARIGLLLPGCGCAPGAAYGRTSDLGGDAPPPTDGGSDQETGVLADGPAIDVSADGGLDATVPDTGFERPRENLPPLWDPIESPSVAERQFLRFRVSATDPEGDPIRFSHVALTSPVDPSEIFSRGEEFNPETGEFSWLVPDWVVGDTEMTDVVTAAFRVTDLYDTGVPRHSPEDRPLLVVSILVSPNSPPILLPLPPQIVNEGEILSFRLEAIDPDGDAVQFQITGATSREIADPTFDPLSGEFSWQPSRSLVPAGVAELGLSAAFLVQDVDPFGAVIHVPSEVGPEGGLEVPITVRNVNSPPEWVPRAQCSEFNPRCSSEILPTDVPRQWVFAGQEIAFPNAVFDPDEDLVTYLLIDPPPGAEVDPVSGTFRWTPTPDQVGDHEIVLRITDPEGLETEVRLPITVMEECRAGEWVVSWIAGNMHQGFSGDGGPAREAALTMPSSLVVDEGGNLYFTDRGYPWGGPNNHRVRKIDPSGVLTTFAGNGTAGFAGDGGPAVEASLYQPTAVAVDSVHNVYIVDGAWPIATLEGCLDESCLQFRAEEGNCRIRMVDPSGTISTFAGIGCLGSSGDGGPATEAAFFADIIAIDSADNVYLTDNTSCTVRKIDRPTGTISTVAGNGVCGFSGDGGPATEATLRLAGWIGGLTFDSDENLYIADILNHRVRRVQPDGMIDTVAGNGDRDFYGDGGPAIEAALWTNFAVGGLAVQDNQLLIADTDTNRIRQVDLGNGTISTFVGASDYMGFPFGNGGPPDRAFLNFPSSVTFDRGGNLYATDWWGSMIRKVSPCN